MLSVQVQKIEKECSLLIGEYTLLNEPFPPAVRTLVLVVGMWVTASHLVVCRVYLNEVVIKWLSVSKRITSTLEA